MTVLGQLECEILNYFAESTFEHLLASHRMKSLKY